MGLVRNENENGMTRSIFKVSNDQEAYAYQSLLDMDMPTCPECGKPMKPTRDGMLLVVENPLFQTLGMDICTITPVCPNCGKTSSIVGEIDLNPAFPTVLSTLKIARERYEQLKAGKKKHKGGSNG